MGKELLASTVLLSFQLFSLHQLYHNDDGAVKWSPALYAIVKFVRCTFGGVEEGGNLTVPLF